MVVQQVELAFYSFNPEFRAQLCLCGIYVHVAARFSSFLQSPKNASCCTGFCVLSLDVNVYVSLLG